MLGWDAIPAIVRPDLTEDEAEYLTLIENLQREDADPFTESEQVTALLAKHPAIEVALSTGRSEQWIRVRASLSHLIPEWRTKKDDSGPWPIGHLELIARLPDSAQLSLHAATSEFWERPTLPELQEKIESLMHRLTQAPWSLQSLAYNPTKAGACADCAKRSGCNPSLFPEADNYDSCLDAECWSAKMSHFIGDRVAALRKENPDLVTVFDYPACLDASDPVRKNAEPVRAFIKAHKKDTGAVAAFVVDGPQAGRTIYLKRYNENVQADPDTPKSKKRSADMTLDEKMAKLDIRRRYKALSYVAEKLRLESESPRVILATAGAFPQVVASVIATLGAQAYDYLPFDCEGSSARAVLDLSDSPELAIATSKQCAASLCRYVGTLLRANRITQWDPLTALIDKIGFSWESFMSRATTEIPVPKSWSKEA